LPVLRNAGRTYGHGEQALCAALDAFPVTAGYGLIIVHGHIADFFVLFSDDLAASYELIAVYVRRFRRGPTSLGPIAAIQLFRPPLCCSPSQKRVFSASLCPNCRAGSSPDAFWPPAISLLVQLPLLAPQNDRSDAVLKNDVVCRVAFVYSFHTWTLVTSGSNHVSATRRVWRASHVFIAAPLVSREGTADKLSGFTAPQYFTKNINKFVLYHIITGGNGH
jgi:hypothetical protein